MILGLGRLDTSGARAMLRGYRLFRRARDLGNGEDIDRFAVP